MDEGPFRTPSRPGEGDTGNTPDATSKPTTQPKPIHTEQKRVQRSSLNYTPKPEKSKKRIAIIVAAIIAVAIVALGIWWAVGNISKSTTAIDTSKYQAVFFTNGQVYFGKLHTFNDDYMKLTDVYYLQSQATEDDSKNPQETSSDQSSTTLIKLGDEIHGPEDEMVISKDQVLFFENLKKDGKVSQSIEKFKNPN